MTRNALIGLMFLTSVSALVSVPAFAEDPTLHQVYEAADAGKLNEAQAMMDKVLRDHPGSAKAHFVEAELLAKQGRSAAARTELETAEHLSPGLSFANSQAVQHLRARIGSSSLDNLGPSEGTIHNLTAPRHDGFPWGLIVVGAGLIAFIVVVSRAMSRRNPPGVSANAMGYGPTAPVQPYAAGGAGPMAAAGGGLGSGILGGLATGAAVGAGMVAGEALMHHFTDGTRSHANTDQSLLDGPSPAESGYDMGGADFGLADNASWDDSSDGGDDWT